MESSRFEEGLSIEAYLERIVARRSEWIAGFDKDLPDGLPSPVPGLRAVVLAEDWSWECAIALPPILRFLSVVPGVATRVFPRDESLDVAMAVDPEDPLAIPRVAFFDAGGERIERWGPRPRAAEGVLTEKEAHRPKNERIGRLREWYAKDGGRAGVAELAILLRSIE